MAAGHAMDGAVGKTVRIGGASGFWGDSSVGAPQLVLHGDIDYLVFDYLAELTMSILAAARAKNPALGYATDFVQVAMKPLLKDIAARGIRVISNAGGVNPLACADALRAIAAEQGMDIKIAVVLGDDVMPLADALRGEDVREMQNGAPLPARLLTANAYLGALPIRRALAEGAQIVITGRCVDSAVTLGALMHEFGWAEDDFDRLAQGSLAGHIIECGCQATGGLHTDWQAVPDWPNIGYPVIECHADGRFIVTKPPGTGGLVNRAVVAEQMLYEIGDPAAYRLPDVCCDFTPVRISDVGEHRVRVEGARGRPPGGRYKVSATYMDGFRCTAQLTIVGIAAVAKAQRTGEAILARCRTLFAQAGLRDFSRTRIEVLGSEAGNYGPRARGQSAREVVLQVAVMHPDKAALELFAREIAPAGTSWSPGTTGASGRPSPSPCIRQFAFLLDKQRLQPRVVMGEVELIVNVPLGSDAASVTTPAAPAAPADPGDAALAAAEAASPSTAPALAAQPSQKVRQVREVPLIELAWARSGDKGDLSNIGVIARQPEWLPLLREQLTPERVRDWLGHLVRGPVTRFDLPGIAAMNFVCEQALDGGGMSSLRNDPLGKGMAQILLEIPIRVPVPPASQQ